MTNRLKQKPEKIHLEIEGECLALHTREKTAFVSQNKIIQVKMIIKWDKQTRVMLFWLVREAES